MGSRRVGDGGSSQGGAGNALDETHSQIKHTEHRLNTQNTVEAERQRVATHKAREETHLLKGNKELSEPFSLFWLAQLLFFCSFFPSKLFWFICNVLTLELADYP